MFDREKARESFGWFWKREMANRRRLKMTSSNQKSVEAPQRREAESHRSGTESLSSETAEVSTKVISHKLSPSRWTFPRHLRSPLGKVRQGLSIVPLSVRRGTSVALQVTKKLIALHIIRQAVGGCGCGYERVGISGSHDLERLKSGECSSPNGNKIIP